MRGHERVRLLPMRAMFPPSRSRVMTSHPSSRCGRGTVYAHMHRCFSGSFVRQSHANTRERAARRGVGAAPSQKTPVLTYAAQLVVSAKLVEYTPPT